MEKKSRKTTGDKGFIVAGDSLVFSFSSEESEHKYAGNDFLLLENFISKKELKELLKFTITKESELKPSKVYKQETKSGQVDRHYRRSKVMAGIGPFQSLFADKIKEKLTLIFEQLKIKPFKINNIDAQITATNDGEFFKPHTDNGGAPQKRRKISYVFYFYQEPKPYTGGELKLYDPVSANAKKKKYKAVIPMQNTIVFFDSGALHEVTKVKCPSRKFSASRFTLNGWLYK